MKPWMKVLAVTVLVAAPAMMLGPVIWPPAEVGPEPTAGQFPFFLFLAAFEALTFGLGVSFLLFGFAPLKRPLAARRGGRGSRTSRSAGSWSPGGPTTICTSIPAPICRDSSTSSTAFT